MSLGCNCENGLSNTGTPNCVPIQSVTSTMVMVAITANDGTLNGVDLNAPLPSFTALINEPDASKRWFPLPKFENVELPKADSQFEEASSGRMVFLRQGKRSFTGELWAEDSSPTLLGKMQNNRCVEFGVYIIDVNGNLVGSQQGGFLRPIPVDNPSFNPTYTFATDATVSKIMVAFDFNRLFDESTMYMITPTEAGINFNDLTGLIDVNFLNSIITSTSITFDAKLDYGTAINKILFKGAVSADFLLTNNTTVATVATTVVENSDGNYTVSFIAQTTGDSLTLSIAKTGYDGETTFVAL